MISYLTKLLILLYLLVNPQYTYSQSYVEDLTFKCLQPPTKMNDVDMRLRVFIRYKILDEGKYPTNKELEGILAHSGKIATICCICREFVGIKDGHGVEGISHGYCESCLLEERGKIARTLDLPKAEKKELVEREEKSA